MNVKNLLRRYETYFQQYGQALLQDVPHRKSDLRVYEAIYHFHLYKYLSDFLGNKRGRVVPEFPTGNGRGPLGRDLIIHYAGHIYGIEVKSFADSFGYKAALIQAARYARKLKTSQIWLAFFVETIDDANRQLFEQPYHDATTRMTVDPIFIATMADNH